MLGRDVTQSTDSILLHILSGSKGQTASLVLFFPTAVMKFFKPNHKNDESQRFTTNRQGTIVH